MDGGGVGLLQIGGIGGGEPQRPGLGINGAQGQAGGLNAHGGGVLVVGSHRSGSPAATSAHDRGDGRAVQAAVRHVTPEADDASHTAEVYA